MPPDSSAPLRRFVFKPLEETRRQGVIFGCLRQGDGKANLRRARDWVVGRCFYLLLALPLIVTIFVEAAEFAEGGAPIIDWPVFLFGLTWLVATAAALPSRDGVLSGTLRGTGLQRPSAFSRCGGSLFSRSVCGYLNLEFTQLYSAALSRGPFFPPRKKRESAAYGSVWTRDTCC